MLQSLQKTVFLFCITIAFVCAEERNAPASADYNITLVTDSAPDFTDIASYIRSVSGQYSTPQEKAIGVWRWSQRLRKQTAWPDEGGLVVLDPIFFFTSYGYTQCGIISGIDNSIWLNLGWKAHYVQLGDHTVNECSWDDGKTWHMFDNSMSIYCFNDSGAVASVREIEHNPKFYLENFAPECGTNPAKGLKDQQAWRSGSDRPVEYQRTLANGMDSFLPPNEIMEDHLAIRWGRNYVLNLRPGEYYTRYFNGLDAGKSDPRYYRPLRGKDVEIATGDKNIRGNGQWHYAPNLRDPATRANVYMESGVTWNPEGVSGPGTVTFKVSAANVVTSAKVTLQSVGATLSVSRDAGGHWESLPIKDNAVELRDQVAGDTEFLVRVELKEASSKLSNIAIDTITQLNRAALPKLSRGPNRVQLRLGPQVDTITLAPSVLSGNHTKTVFEEKGVDVNPKPYFNVATLRPALKGEPCFATWKIDVPTPIVDVVYGGNITDRSSADRVTLLHSWNGHDYVEDFRKSNAALPYDQVVNVRAGDAPADSRAVYFRYQFETPDAPASWKSCGIQSALMTVHHRPRNTGFAPIEVTYCWIEHRESGDVERRHSELITDPAHEYTINVGGFREPTLKWIRMNLKGSGPDGDALKAGYSDGNDAGPGSKPAWVKYTYGKNLALGKKYTLDGKQDDHNPDSGNDLTDGIIAPPDTYVSVKYMPTNVMFAKDVSPVATLDLGSVQTFAAVLVHAGQEPGFHLTFPDSITVETSADGKTFESAGAAAFNQVFEPPADFVPWELDDSPQFDALPAGGRLVYAYRILFDKSVSARYVRVSCTCRKGWAILLSEIEVFDKVDVHRDVPPLVFLPPLEKKP